MDTDEAKALIEEFLDAYNRFDIDTMMELVHPEVEFRNYSGGDLDATVLGREEFRALAEQSAFLFTSRTQTPSNFQSNGEVMSVDIEFTGTLATDMPGGLKAGQQLLVSGRSEYCFRDEKIHRLTDYS